MGQEQYNLILVEGNGGDIMPFKNSIESNGPTFDHVYVIKGPFSDERELLSKFDEVENAIRAGIKD